MNIEKIYLGKNKANTKGVFLPLKMQGDVSYPSIAIYGVPATGKSTLLQKLCVELGHASKTVVIIDAYNSFASHNLAMNYKDYFDNHVNRVNVYDEGLTCGLFDMNIRENGRSENVLEICRSLAEIIANAKRMGQVQRIALEDAIYCLATEGDYEQKGLAGLSSILDAQESPTADAVNNKIAILTKNNIFRPGKLSILPGRVNVLDLNDFTAEDDVKTVIEIICWLIYRLSYTEAFGGEDIFVCVDECHKTVTNEKSMLAKMLNLGRKQKIRLLLATQQFVNPKTELGKRLNEICYSIYFRPAEGTYRETAMRIAGHSRINEMTSKLNRLNQGEFIISGGAVITEDTVFWDPVAVVNVGPVFDTSEKIASDVGDAIAS